MDVPALASGISRLPAFNLLLDELDDLRREISPKLDPVRRRELGQFFTPAIVARMMADLLQPAVSQLRLLDAGAGIGSLTTACVARICEREPRPRLLSVVAYEVDPMLACQLQKTLTKCSEYCEDLGIGFKSEIRQEDFIASVSATEASLGYPASCFDVAILNPPYRKIGSGSPERLLLRQIGIESGNLYTAFLELAARQLVSGGEMIAITPRSFCSGVHFRAFRRSFLSTMALRHIHVFSSRGAAFGDDKVLQETILFRAVKASSRQSVTLATSADHKANDIRQREVAYSNVVRPDDPESFIRLELDDLASQATKKMARFRASLADLGLSVSTGRVVDFRAVSFLRQGPDEDTVPLIYPEHIDANGFVRWPKAESRKPNALVRIEDTESLLLPCGNYVVTRRFSSKEQRRRIVAAILDQASMPASPVALENHLNYFHSNGGGLSLSLAKGLAAFLSSSMVDGYVRQFNGHTQINAADLRSLRYPALAELVALGQQFGSSLPAQQCIDQLIDKSLFGA